MFDLIYRYVTPPESSKNGLQQFEKRFGVISALQELRGFVPEFGAQGNKRLSCNCPVGTKYW